MADEKRIVIELRAGAATDNDGEEEETSLTDMLRVAQHPIKAFEKAVFGKSALAYYTYNQMKSLTINTAKYAIGRYFNLSENYKAEQDLDNTLNVLSNISGAYGSLIGGALVGAKVGHPLIGAAIGGGVWVTNTILNAQKTWDAQNLQLTATRMQSGFQKVRLGLIDDGRGTQN